MRLAAFGLLAAGAAYALAPSAERLPSAVADQSSVTILQQAGLDGVWRSRGYGWLMEISDGSVQFYDETASLCVASDTVLDPNELAGRLKMSENGKTLRLPVDDAVYLHTFDRIGGLPEACGATPDSAPRAVLDAVIDIFTRHYAFFDERNVEWPALADATRRQLGSDASDGELLEVLGALIAKVDDAHVSLQAESNGRSVERETGAGETLTRLAEQAAAGGVTTKALRKRWEREYWERDIADVLLNGDGITTGNDLIVFGLIAADIGYIAVRSMEGYSEDGDEDVPKRDTAILNGAMEKAMSLFSDVSAVIVDISINNGGHDIVARELAGRFAAERTVGYYKYAGDADGDAPQAIYVEPSRGKRFSGPVYLLTSDVTVSAAEILTLSMRALPNVTHMGGPTRGALSDILSKPLPNGWSINLSNEVYLDAEGRGWEGIGIVPDVTMTVFSKDDVGSGHLQAVLAIVGWIKGRG
jgi:carboxyl-terminal processing protease